MQKLFFVLLMSLVLPIKASSPLKIGVITDLHFLSTKLMDGKYAIQNVVDKNGRDFIASPEIIDKVLGEYEESNIDILLVCGDLTKDGEKESHLELKDKLDRLSKQGVKIFVIPGNHDINVPSPVGYQGNQTYSTENISAEDFSTIYKDFGYENAISRDKESLSYVNALDENTWLLAIDAARYDEYKDRTITAGRIKTTTERWITKMLDTASQQQKQVVAMIHWGIAEHLPMQSVFFSSYLVDNHKYYADLLADNGVKLAFTGHFHSNDISVHRSDLGNTIYDIETGTLSSYPFSYRFVELCKDSIEISTRNITSIESDSNLVSVNKEVMKRVATRMARPMLKNKKLNLSERFVEPMAEIAGELFLLHLAGDEVLDEQTKNKLKKIFEEMDIPLDNDFNLLELDLPPKDNNLTIYF